MIGDCEETAAEFIQTLFDAVHWPTLKEIIGERFTKGCLVKLNSFMEDNGFDPIVEVSDVFGDGE